jgi:hypothetical protein
MLYDNKPLIFIDDSGDTGFSLNKGSSKYFIIACVIFCDNLDAEETALILKKYRKSLGHNKNWEFKFSKTKSEYIKGALNKINNCNFSIRAICVDKIEIRSNYLKTNKNSFYNFIITQVLEKIPNMKQAKIKLDGHADRQYKQSAKTYFKRELNRNNRKISKIAG